MTTARLDWSLVRKRRTRHLAAVHDSHSWRCRRQDVHITPSRSPSWLRPHGHPYVTALMCHTGHLYLPEIKGKKERERERNHNIYGITAKWQPAAKKKMKAITCSRWKTSILIFNRMCFIASYLQPDLTDPTNHKLPYQRRISGLIGVVEKDHFI